MKRINCGRLGALLSDLMAHCWAFSTENETGDSLKIRKMEIKANLNAIMKIIDEN